jgi:hypothetical protein
MNLKTELDFIFSLYIRLRDADENGIISCFCCKKHIHWKEAENMHFVHRTHLFTRYDETNCHAGCRDCNCYHDGNIEIYKEKLIERYGTEKVEKLLSSKYLIKKMNNYDYEEMTKSYKKKVGELKKEK